MLDPRIHVIALGVKDIAKSKQFYEQGLGLHTESHDANAQIIFFKTNGTILELFKCQDDTIDNPKPNPNGCVLSHNVMREEEVDAILVSVEKAGGTILKPGTKTSWGGYHGYFADPNNYCWAVTYWSQWRYQPDGTLII